MRQNDEGVVEAHWKGAAEIVLDLCKRFVNERGEFQEMTPDKVRHIFRLRHTKGRKFKISKQFYFLGDLCFFTFFCLKVSASI